MAKKIRSRKKKKKINRKKLPKKPNQNENKNKKNGEQRSPKARSKLQALPPSSGAQQSGNIFFGRVFGRKRTPGQPALLSRGLPPLPAKNLGVRPRQEMVYSDGCGKGLESKPAGDRRRCENSSTIPFFFCRRRYRTSKPIFRRSSVSLLLAVTGLALALFGDGATAAASGGGRRESIRHRRAGNVAGLEEGRISLSKVTKMLTSSVHMEVCMYLATCFCVRGEHPLRPSKSSCWLIALSIAEALSHNTRINFGPFRSQFGLRPWIPSDPRLGCRDVVARVRHLTSLCCSRYPKQRVGYQAICCGIPATGSFFCACL